YVGPVPDLHFFAADDMFVSERQALLKWHETQRANDVVCNYWTETLKYAQMDTRILAEACLTFRKLILSIAPIEVFHECLTLPQMCLKIYKMLFLQPKSIVLIDPDKLNPKRAYSKEAILWLDWQAWL